MKELYEVAEMEVIAINSEDIIRTSGCENESSDDEF